MAESKWSKESIEQKSGGLDKKIYEFRPKGISPSDSEDIYVSIIESIEDGYYEVDLSGNFTFFNDSMARIIGYTRDELMGMNNRQYMDHYNAKKVFRAFNKVYLTGIPTKAFDWELIRKDGSRCFVEASVSLRRDSGNQPVGYFGIARDISQRKLMEQALKESEENYRNIIESIVDGYYEVDLSGNFTFFNESMARIIGYTRDELMGMNNRQYMDDYNAKKIFQAFNKVYLTGIPTKAFDWEVIRRDGSRCFLEVSACLKRDLTNQPIGFFGMARDITRRKKIAETLKAREKELEAKTKSLEEVNIALKVLLEKKNEEKAELETHVMSNVKELVLP